MGTLFDEFGDMYIEDVADVVNEKDLESSYIQDSLRYITQAKNLIQSRKGNTYAGIDIRNIQSALDFEKSDNIPWEHVKMTLDVSNLRDISNGKLEEFVVPAFVEELESIGYRNNSGFGYNETGRNCLRHITLDANLLIIASNTFYLYKKLEKISFESNCKLVRIGSYTFAYCESLKELDLSTCEYLEGIDSCAFMFSGVETLRLNHNTIDISADTFKDSNIKTIYIGDDKYSIDEFNKNFELCGYKAFWEKQQTYDF